MIPKTTEAAIIGAGIIGSSIAWRLAQHGIRVTLFDAGRVGGEASTAGAGMLAPGGEVEQQSRWSHLALESSRLYPAFIDELRDETGFAIDYRASGAIDLAYSEPEWIELRARARSQAPLGIHTELLTHNAIPGARKAGLAGGIHYPADALVDPHDVMRALKTACQCRAVTVAEHIRVLGIDISRPSVEVIFTESRLTADLAILAAGAWSDQIEILDNRQHAALPKTSPVKGHLLGYNFEPKSLDPILRHGHTYVLQRSNGFTIAGSSSEQVGFDRRIDPGVADDIRRRAGRFLHTLLEQAPAVTWAGFRPGMEGMDPLAGRFRDTNLWLAYGHYRNGILLAPVTARLLADEITSSLGMG